MDFGSTCDRIGVSGPSGLVDEKVAAASRYGNAGARCVRVSLAQSGHLHVTGDITVYKWMEILWKAPCMDAPR